MRLLISRKLAEAVDRMRCGTRCCTAVITGPNQRMLSALATSNGGHASHRFGAIRPTAKTGAVISQAMAGSFAYQPLSKCPSRSANQPPAKTPVHPPRNTTEAMNCPRSISPRWKLLSSTDGVHVARPYPHSELEDAAKAISQNTG